MKLNVPAINPDAPRPVFCDSAACKDWLRQLPMTNIQGVQKLVAEQMEMLGHYPLAALDRLKVLEVLRDTVFYLSAELGKRYRSKPVPFAQLEQSSWDNGQKLWCILETGYRQCLQAYLDNDAGVSGFGALITQRAIDCIVAQMLAFGHAYRSIPAALWRRLHSVYAFAEKRGFASKRIKDSLNRDDGTSSCESAYAKALLLDLADPQQLTSKQLLLIDRWLDKLAARTAITAEKPPTPTLTLIAVDIGGDRGASVFDARQTMAEQRFLDSERLALSLRKRIKFLHGGGNPTEVGLGEDCIQPSCEALLTQLYQHWCSVTSTRTSVRQSVEGTAELCFAFPAMYFFLNDGVPFKQPGDTLDVAPEIMQDMHMFGHVTERTRKLLLSRLGYSLENWNCLDQSTGGFRINRATEGERIGQNQLVAMRPPGAEHFVLAAVRWLAIDGEGRLGIGVRTLPGTPTVVAARQMTLNPMDAGPFVPAFRLSETAQQQEPASLILPIGWFQPGRRLQIYSNQSEAVKLTGLIEKGANFDWVSYVAEPLY